MSVRVVLVIVASLAALNYVVGMFLGTVGFNIGRAMLAIYGGWYVVRCHGSLWVAAFAGILIMVIDHILLKGGTFLLLQAYWPDVIDNQGYGAFVGVLMSFAMFAPVLALISMVSGFCWQR